MGDLSKELKKEHGDEFKDNAPPEYWTLVQKQRDVALCKLKTRIALLGLANRMSAPDEIKDNLFSVYQLVRFNQLLYIKQDEEQMV